MSADVEGDVYVLVEHPFEYTGKDGRRVAIQPNERYRLLRRSTEHWWHVRSEPGGRPFYLPAQYVYIGEATMENSSSKIKNRTST